MPDKLIIVESPAKANTIKKFLGGNYKVMASMGHIRDLPKSKLGVDIEHDFEPEYINIRGKGDLIKSLKKEAKSAKKVYLATDPDREGEAIAWHLSHILEIPEDSVCRVTFNEITKETVQKSIKEPRMIDMNLTDAQQARRVLDRIVGYKISPILWKKVKRGLSAGRVQSVAVKLIVDREEEIEKFIPQEYWNIYAILVEPNSNKKFEAKYNLPFTLLSDAELTAIQAYDVWKEKNMYGKKMMGVVRTTYLIDENGIIEKVFKNVKPDTNAGDILQYIREKK